MEAIVHLDTHVVAWLYAGQLEKIPPFAQQVLDDNELAVSPMVVLELQSLFEIKRTRKPAFDVLQELSSKIGLRIDGAPFAEVARVATQLSWTRDPFDRLIVAHATFGRCLLVTADENIRSHYRDAIWSRARVRR